MGADPNYPQFPLYVPSKGRAEYMMTSKALTKMGVHHYVVVEPSQMDEYIAAINEHNLSATALELDMSYKEKYELLDDLGLSKSTGPGPARNFIWEHSMANGFEWHWVMDDNIRTFYRLNNNSKIPAMTPAFWRAMEDFVLRYKNVAMAGPNYAMFCPRKTKVPPFVINTRIYSCNLIRNSVPYRWRGRYNEDTILSLDMLKGKWCTVQFYAFLQEKMNTQKMRGGNSAEFYFKEGTLAKSKMQVKAHPDISRLAFKFGRWHHHVDYTVFKRQKLIKLDGLQISDKNNEYGMKLLLADKSKNPQETA